NLIDPTALIGYNYPQSGFRFGSEAVNREYSILSTMLSSSAPLSDMAAPQVSFADMEMVESNAWPPALMTSPQCMNGQMLKKDGNINGKRKVFKNTPESIYATVTKPFSYIEGFHYLVKYVRERMDKDHQERIVRAIATFRPSFIALIMNLTEEDLIFMEKCFQRTLLEFEKLISFSGTPTVVWRRTGEITLVGKEFTLLTQWSKEQLVGKKYIYEVMSNESAVEYWGKFAAHAFESSGKSVMTTCALITPQQTPVLCTFCFTIKRDIFDIPLAIVGNVSVINEG
ncbi:4249_t:CDS:2, partial [Paraglomus occultum]